MAATSSAIWIHGKYCLPLPSGPPANSRKGSVILGRAPPCALSTTPVRMTTRRTPIASTSTVEASQSKQTRARKSSPGRGLFGHGLIAARPIIPHSRGLNQRSWHSFGITDCGHKRIACSDSALSYPLFAFRGPTSVGDSFAGEIDNRIHLGHEMAPSFGSFTVPLFQSYAIGPSRPDVVQETSSELSLHSCYREDSLPGPFRSDPCLQLSKLALCILPLSESPLITGGRPSFANLRPPTMPRHSVPFPEDE